jgi:hypothetical protein
MGRHRLTAASIVTAALLAVALAVPGTASAAVAQTRTQVVRSLLTGPQIGDGWHRSDSSSGGSAVEADGCDPSTGASSPGLRFTADRSYQYLTSALFADETIYAFGTVTSARRDFNASTRLMDSCSSFTVDGNTFTVTRMPAPTIADQTARYRMKGSVTTPAGKVPMTLFMVATRLGRQEVVTTLVVGGALTAAQRTDVAQASVRLCRLATAKVAARLGR